ncbi:hypothetical protein niasHS_003132 [Heterodera schachtii]|uniref:RING-type domain-containing protein n=1 Tax=Heterodera schachtii TaxID=97005 RepID=A0ABD2K9U2_HETSC
MMPFAKGGLGLKCMAQNCENPISWQEIKDRLAGDYESIQALENHCADLCVAMAGICLERCSKCDCVVEIENDEQKIWCHNCDYAMCRRCNANWTDEHDKLSCEQFAKLKNYKDDPL